MSDIPNYILLDDGTALGGQPSEQQFRALRAAGYDLVINLAPDGLPTSLPGQADLLASLGIEYRHIPVVWSRPEPDQFREFVAAMDSAAGRQMLIHCQANFRVTAFYALYAMARLDWSRSRANALIDRIWTSRPGFGMDEVWARFIADMTPAGTRLD